MRKSKRANGFKRVNLSRRTVLRSLCPGILLCALGLPVFTAPAKGPVQLCLKSVGKPETGVFVVASRKMPDPRFYRSVILILSRGEEGTLGLILNRPSGVPLNEAVPDLKAFSKKEHRIFVGGPVARNALMLLARNDAPPEHAQPVLDDIYWSFDSRVLEQMLKKDKDETELRIYAGHSAWAPGQLEFEIENGGWQLFEGDPSFVFYPDLDALYDVIMEKPEQLMVRQIL